MLLKSECVLYDRFALSFICTVSEKPVYHLCMLINLCNKKKKYGHSPVNRLAPLADLEACALVRVEVCYRISVPASKDGKACIFMRPAMHTHCPGWPNAVDVALLLAAVTHLQLSKTAFLYNQT